MSPQLPNKMPEKLVDYEQWVIDNAVEWSVYDAATRNKQYFNTLQEAIDVAKTLPRGMLYAITEHGRSTMINQKDYPKYDKS